MSKRLGTLIKCERFVETLYGVKGNTLTSLILAKDSGGPTHPSNYVIFVCDFDDSTLARVLEGIRKNGMSIKRSADKYNISKSTVQRKLRHKHMKFYRGQTILLAKEECIISHVAITAAN